MGAWGQTSHCAYIHIYMRHNTKQHGVSTDTYSGHQSRTGTVHSTKNGVSITQCRHHHPRMRYLLPWRTAVVLPERFSLVEWLPN